MSEELREDLAAIGWPGATRTLCIYMTRGERTVREAANKAFGYITHVVIVVDGEEHRYDADALIALLESLEVDE